MIELRSDTFTLPTPTMRRAMASAEVGDDVYGEDPTVARLERCAADRLGLDAACLMPSGTMANLAAIMAQTPRGQAVVVGDESDIWLYEAGGAAVCGGAVYLPRPNRPDGTIDLADLRAAYPDEPEDPQFAVPALICLENTHNRCGGVPVDPAYQASVVALAREYGLAVHLDGARLFNAAVALGVPAAALTVGVDSVQFCLSKGLSAPIGSILAGSWPVIERARRIRKMLGGGMRQAGVVAAAGLVALDEMVDRLAEDHTRARDLATGLAGIPGIAIDPATVHTNIVLFRVTDERFTAEAFIAAAAVAGLGLYPFGHERIRAVTHAGLGPDAVPAALSIVEGILA